MVKSTFKYYKRCLSYILLLTCIFTISYEVKASEAAENTKFLYGFSLIKNFTVDLVENHQRDGEKKSAYLTFDDGPSYIVTNRILDVLNKEKTRATFFVVGKEVKGRQGILRRIYKEGHSIGLHTYTHNFKQIYKSEDMFIHEMKKTSFMINEILGITPSAVRFPGGSDKALNEHLLQKLHDNNLKVYDWNVNIGDGINASFPPQKLLQNSKKIKGNASRAIILAHCNSNNSNTYKALPAIIKYYREQGYEFKVIDNNTPEYYYKFKKK